MTPYRMIALVLVVVLSITAATPARAEAMEVGTILLLVGVGVAVVILVVYLIAANVSERRHAEAPTDTAQPSAAVAAYVLTRAATPVVESP